jgi:MFS family permease
VPPSGPTPPPPKQGRFKLGGGYSLLGLFFGFIIGLVLPPAIAGFGSAILGELNISQAAAFVAVLALAVLIPVAIIVLLSKKLNREDESQAAVRTAIIAAGFASLFIWALLSLLIGGCIALLTMAYA